MKIFKISLRIWITAASLAGFLGSWGFIAHAQKPVPFLQSTPPAASQPTPISIPTLEPLPSFNSQAGNLQPLPSLPQINTFPMMRTRGS